MKTSLIVVIPVFAVLLFACPALGQDYAFTTLAGAAGHGSNAQLNTPYGVAVDSSGNVFVADTNNHTIRKITADGFVTTVAGSAGNKGTADGVASAARFNSPHGLAVDREGNVFVADSGNHTIRKIAADGVVTTVAGLAASHGKQDGLGSSARFHHPRRVAVDSSGNVFVADTYNNLIRKIGANGLVTTLGGAGDFYFPSGVAVDSSGNVFVADLEHYRICKIGLDGAVTALPGTFWPGDVAVDGSGNVFVADAGLEDNGFTFHSVHKITPAGVITTVAGSTDRGNLDGLGTTARFFGPLGVAVDGAGNLLIADSGNDAIRKISPAGIVTTFAGDVTDGSADGIGGAARFSSPQALAVDDSGTVFVADTRNSTIRKITPAGIVTTLAGLAGSPGSDDGTGAAARFRFPSGVAVDRSGNVFVADTGNGTLRKITTAGVVTTVARFASPTGVAVDGSGNVFVDSFGLRKLSGAGVVTTFNEGSIGWLSYPLGLAVDVSGEVIVADSVNNQISRFTADGVGTIFGGRTGYYSPAGSADGPGYFARFNSPRGVAVDREGSVFIADRGNHTIRKITVSGIVTTIGGTAGSGGSADGVGRAARFSHPAGIAVDSSGHIYVADTANGTIRKGVPVFIAPSIVTAPQSQHLDVGVRATFTAAAEGTGLTYQWKKDGLPVRGATTETYEIDYPAPGDMGFYTVVVAGAAGQVESPVATLTIGSRETSRLGNFSVRGLVPAGGDLTVGFVVGGTGNKSVLVRAVGPTLGDFGVSAALGDPQLEVFAGHLSTVTSSNDDWGGGPMLASAFAGVGAFPLAPSSKDAAVLNTLSIGSTTARVTSGLPGGVGIALTEVYDRDSRGSAARLVNISTLAFVGTGAEAPTLGFAVDGNAPKRLLIRVVGPGLAVRGVDGWLSDPQFTVVPLGKDFAVASNDNWAGDATVASAFISAGAFLLPENSKDAAALVRLPPGGYTVAVSGAGNATGRALVEIYDLGL